MAEDKIKLKDLRFSAENFAELVSTYLYRKNNSTNALKSFKRNG